MVSCRCSDQATLKLLPNALCEQVPDAVPLHHVHWALPAAFGPAGDLLQLQPVRDRRLMHCDGKLSVRSRNVAGEIAAAELVQSLRYCVVHRVRPHLNLMLDVVGIGKGDHAAGRVHERQYRRTESEVDFDVQPS